MAASFSAPLAPPSGISAVDDVVSGHDVGTGAAAVAAAAPCTCRRRVPAAMLDKFPANETGSVILVACDRLRRGARTIDGSGYCASKLDARSRVVSDDAGDAAV